MAVLSGAEIGRRKILSPCRARHECHETTAGLGPAGYDLTAEFDAHGERPCVEIPPGRFGLISARERFRMPDDLLGIVHDKSSWARLGLAVQNTVIEPGWSGYLTLELTNHGTQTLYVRRGAGIAQVVFHVVEGAVARYGGTYQGQPRGPQPTRLSMALLATTNPNEE